MRRRDGWRASILAAGLLLTALALSATAEDEILFDNNNPQGVRSGPPRATRFRLEAGALVTHVRVYHHNGGRGAAPGWIWFDDEQGGLSYGRWKAKGVGTQPGGGALYWECTPNVALPPAVYDVVVSSPGTWSWNKASGEAGIATIKGRRTTPPEPTPPRSPSTPAPTPPPGTPTPKPPPAAPTSEPSGELRVTLAARPEAQGQAVEGDDGFCVMTLPHRRAPDATTETVSMAGIPDEKTATPHVVAAGSRLVLPIIRLENGTPKDLEPTIEVKLIHDESRREMLLAREAGVLVPAYDAKEADGDHPSHVVRLQLPDIAGFLDRLPVEVVDPSTYTIRFEVLRTKVLPFAILDQGAFLQPFRLDRATATKEGDALLVDLEGPALQVHDLEVALILPSGQRIELRDLASREEPRLERMAEGRSRIRIPSELSRARILVSDDEGRQSNYVSVEVEAGRR